MKTRTLSGINLAAPDGLDALFAWSRARFGDLRMEITPNDPAPSPTPESPEPADPSVDPKPDDDDGKGGKDALKADLARERRARQAKDRELAEAQARLKEFEDAKLSEQERAAKDLAELKAQAEAARQEAAAAQLDALRHRIAAEKNVPAALLTGTDEESLTASAEAALSWRGSVTPETPKAPKPDPSVGPRGESVPSGAELYRQKYPQRTPA